MEIINLTKKLVPLFDKFFTLFCESIRAELEIDFCYICTNENYVTTILNIEPDDSVTENDNYKGYGKAISKDGKNYIFIREPIACVINQHNCTDVQNISLQDDIVQLAYSIIFHEVGHCIDNKKRNLIGIEKYTENNRFKVKNILDYFYRSFTCEYNANKFAKKFLSNECIKKQCENIETDYINLKNELDRIKHTFTATQLYEISISVLNSFKIFFSQFVSYLSLSNKENLLEEFVKKNGCYFSITFDINKMDEYFNQDIMPMEVFSCCLKNLMNYGYKFVVMNDSNDAVYF